MDPDMPTLHNTKLSQNSMYIFYRSKSLETGTLRRGASDADRSRESRRFLKTTAATIKAETTTSPATPMAIPEIMAVLLPLSEEEAPSVASASESAARISKVLEKIPSCVSLSLPM